MNNEKKRSFNSMDFFILAVVIITVAAFAVKAQLSGLFGRTDADVKISYSFVTAELDRDKASEFFKEKSELITDSGLVLGHITQAVINDVSVEDKCTVTCKAEGVAKAAGDGYVLFSDTVMKSGSVFILKFGEEILQISITDVQQM